MRDHSIESINPTTGEPIGTFEEHSRAEVDSFMDAADRAQRTWKGTSFQARASQMRGAAEILRTRADAYARLMATEMGKPVREGRAEVEKCAWVCDYYAEQAEDFLADRPIATDAGESFVACRPLGVVLAVMPWNFPLWQVFRFAAPALMAGNGALLKHASNVPGCAFAIEQVFREAGFPDGLFRTLLVSAPRVADIIRDRRVAAVTLTGSTEAGKAIAAEAGACLKKTVLELGGSDPYVILEDANLDEASEICATSRLINGGQSCIAAKRFVVVDAVHDDFVDKLRTAMAARVVGDPTEDQTDVGPLARADLRETLHDQVKRSIEAGARAVLGAEVPDGPGAFYPPSLLVDVGPGMPAYGEELFGPVGAVIRARDEADAIRIANDTVFGLGAAVFTADEARGRRIATDALEAGCCFVNAFVRSDPRLPFGGIKDSGYGRELADLGIRELVNQKTVYVR